MQPYIDRRIFFKVAATGVAGCFVSPMSLLSQTATTTWDPQANILGTAKNVIFVLCTGAPSQTDTFDLHVGPWTPANFTPESVNGIDWPTGLLPTLAGQLALSRFSLIRSCLSTALVHALLQNWAQIARNPTGATGKIAPNIGSIVALELEKQRRSNQKLPGFLSLNGGGSLAGAGYLSSKFAPFDVTPNLAGLANLVHPDGEAPFNSRYSLLQMADFSLRSLPAPFGDKAEEMSDFYSSSRQLMYDPAVTNAFRFTAAEQLRYLGNANNAAFAAACLTARNVLAADLGTHFVQITIGGWDNHTNIYQNNAGVYAPGRQLDNALGNLIADLAAMPGSNGRSLLDETLIVVKGEFGRTVGNITAAGGRDHYFVHSALIAGGGVRGGRVVGKTTADAAFIEEAGWSQDRPVYAEDIAATIYSALGINYTTVRHDDPLGRGFEYVPLTGSYIGTPVADLFQ